MADLGDPPSSSERCLALLRLVSLIVVLFSGALLYWHLPLGWASISVLLISGVAYAFLLIATHEMVHGTFLGMRRLEHSLACLLCWPMAFPYLTYSRLHCLHHRWNGSDVRDPERTTPLQQRRETTGRMKGFWQRQHVLLRIVFLGGLGLIADTAIKGRRLKMVDSRLTLSQWIDGIGVTTVHTVMLIIVIANGLLWRHLLFWLVLERVIGGIVQFRALVEHYGLWRSNDSQLLTQLYASRNVSSGSWINALMGGLPNHSAHHAFPWIPSSRLPEANQRIAAILQSHDAESLPQFASYCEGMRWLWREGHPSD